MAKNKGFTTVELIVTFSLVSVISLFLLQIIIVLKDIYIDAGVKTNLLTQQAILSEKINHDFRAKKVLIAYKCGDNCVKFHFNDHTEKELKYDRDNNTLIYGSFKEELLTGSSFGNIKMTSKTLSAPKYDKNKLNGILSISLPIYNKNFKGEDFGINVVYQYNSYITSISGINVVDTPNTEKIIYLIGADEDISFEGVEYKDPGYYLYDTKNKTLSLNDPSVEVTGGVFNEYGKTYSLIYRYKDPFGNIISEVSRQVNVVRSVSTYKYSGNEQKFVVPISGVYKIEAWGASGGGSKRMKGLGGYTVGTYELSKGDDILIYVGGEGTLGSNAQGGFNGGGKAGAGDTFLAGSGGGATDVRLNGNELSKRIIVAGGGAGAGSRSDSSFVCYGGTAGGATGGIGNCSSNTYLGGGGTQSSGGAAATYKTNCTTVATAGGLGIGGNGASYAYSSSKFAGGGGGGGYYGGGGGSRYGGGGGGSGYCSPSMSTCTIYSGTDTFTSPTGNSLEIGHEGNGLLSITLISVTN